MEKFTKRNVFTAIVNYVENGEFAYTDAEGAKVEVPAEALATFAKHEIELLDNTAAKAKARKAEKAAEPDALAEAVAAALTEDFVTIADIAAKIEDPDATIAKVTNRLNKLVAAGAAEKTDLTFPNPNGGRARKCKGYKRV